MTGRSEVAGSRAALGYGPPKSYEELRAVLTSGSPRLPKRLRQVAVFLWQHPQEVALGTITRIAERADVQPSTLVRFAQAFGYAGFSDLQNLFKDYAKGNWPDGRERGAERGCGGERHLVVGFVEASRTALARALDTFDAARFDAAVAALATAETIYLLGSKRAFPVTAYLSIALAKLGIRNVLVDNVGSTAFEQIGFASPRDAVLAISFSPYNSITPELAVAAMERKAAIVAVTDSVFSPLVPLASAWIEVVDEDFAGFRSPAATIAVSMALALAVARRRETRDPSPPGEGGRSEAEVGWGEPPTPGIGSPPP